MNLNPKRSVRPWYAILLAALAAGVIVFGITQLGTPATSSARTSTEEVAAADGVVQTTVSGSGEVEPGVDDTLNFGTSGTLQSVKVKVGQHVRKGQLIATLDPSSAQLTLEAAEASLTSAEDNLTEVEDGTSTGSSSTGSSNNSSAASSQQTATAASAATVYAAFHKPADSTTTGTTTTTTPPTTTATTTGTTATQTVTVTVPATTGTKTSPTKSPTKTKVPTKKTTPRATKKPTATKKSAATKKAAAGKTTNAVTIKAAAHRTGTTTVAAATTTTTKSKPTAAEIQQAEVQVDEAKGTVTADEKAVNETKLYAPASGMIASLSSDSIGESVSSGSSSASSASPNSGASSSSSTNATSSSSSSGFAELINDNTMTMTVSLSEDDISSVKVGQMATVSITALSGVELAGRVSSISPLGTDSSGVVSYDATITVGQSNSKVLPGMSATASIVTGQGQGVTVENEAITGSGSNATVQLVDNGKVSTQPVVVGLKGSSRSQIVSGLKAGQDVKITITLPSLGTSTTSSSSSSSSGAGGLGGAGFPGGAGGGTGFRAAARAFFGGGGG